MNNINTVEEVSKYIDEIKKQVNDIQNKNEELINALKDLSTGNVIKDPKLLFQKTEEVYKDSNLNNFNSFPLFLVIFFCCISLFIGKFLNFFFSYIIK